MNWMDLDQLVGRRFGTDFTIRGAAPAMPGRLYDPDRQVLLELNGGIYWISVAELRTVIERGFVVEREEGP